MSESLNLSKTPIEIEAGHFGIALRQFTLGDSGHIFKLINRNRKHFSQFGDTTSEKYKTLADVEQSILNPSNPDRLRFGIWSYKKEFLGSINLTPDRDNKKRGEVGYYLSPEHIGKGHMLDAVLTLATAAFYNFGYEELYAKVHPDNLASEKVLSKAGFRLTQEDKQDKIFTLLKHNNS